MRNDVKILRVADVSLAASATAVESRLIQLEASQLGLVEHSNAVCSGAQARTLPVQSFGLYPA
ncbi:hypothetical protein D9M68_940260 [compost metagenome]